MVPSDRIQSVKSCFVNAPKLDPAGEHWRAMISNSSATLKTYRASDLETRKVTRQILGAALYEMEQQSLEGHALAYLIGRLDEIDLVQSPSPTKQSE